MTPDEVQLVQESFAALGDRTDDMAKAFYEHLFALDPSIRSMFSTDPAVQRKKFVDEMEEIVRSVPDLDRFVAETRDLGARHVAYGVRVAHYKTVGEALLAALQEVGGEAFTERHREAWSLAYNMMAETMMHGARS